MGFMDDLESVGSDMVHAAEDVVMAPAEIAHWALGKMFGNPDDSLEKIATELADMAKQVEQLSHDINSALGQLTWHGTAADAFINHANGRVRELNDVADQLQGLSGAVKHLATIY